MLKEVTSETLTEVGGADGTGQKGHILSACLFPTCYNYVPSPASPVIAVAGTLTALPAVLIVATVIM